MHCGDCGRPLEEDARYCPKCGAPVQATPQPAPQEPAPGPISTPAPPPPVNPSPQRQPSGTSARSALIQELTRGYARQPDDAPLARIERPAYPKPQDPAALNILREDLIYMGATAFERYLLVVCQAFGYRRKPAGGGREIGADFVFEREGKTMVMRMELNGGSVGPGRDSVEAARRAQEHYRADEAVVATNRFFEDDAREAAAELGVDLWDIISLRERRNDILSVSR